MKKKIFALLLIIFKYHLKIIYFFIKIFTIRKSRVFLLSRQYSSLSINYKLIIQELEKENVKYVYICKEVPKAVNILVRNERQKNNVFKSIKEAFSYYFNLYKQMYYAATSKVIIVDGYNLIASVLKHKKNTCIIQLWHALAAIKKFGFQTIGKKDGLNPKTAKILCMHENYKFIISGSKAMNKYFALGFNVSEDKVKEIGTPTIDYLLQDNNETIKRLYQKYPMMKEKRNILYSPTFRNDGSNNIESVIKDFNFKDNNLILTFHPKLDNNINNENIITINRSEFSTYDVLRVADYVITDYSALAIDTCVLNKKLLFYVYDYNKYKEENGLNIDLYKELKGNVSDNFKDIMKIIDENKYNLDSYKKFRNKYLTSQNGGCARKIVELIKEQL